jgi:hypothetical protein
MKKLMITSLIVGGIVLQASGVFANTDPVDIEHVQVTYEQSLGSETLFQFAKRMYGDEKCWPVIASYPENQILFSESDLLDPGIELKDQSLSLQTVAVPHRVNCDQILHPFDFPNILVVSEESEVIRTYGNRIYDSWQHFWSGDEVPFPTFMDVAEGKAKERAWEHRWNWFNNRYDYSVNQKADFSYDWEDSFHSALDGSIVYRAQLGEEWFIVKASSAKSIEVSQGWDYVDQLDVSTLSSTFTYRARDKQGQWYIVKNDRATRLAFEPEYVFFNELVDEPFAMNDKAQGSGRVASIFGDWNSFGRPVRVTSVDTSGNMLFTSYVKVPLAIREESRIDYNRGDSSKHRYEQQYWLNDVYIGASNFNVYPLYSQTGAFGWGQDGVFFAGVPHEPSFDSDDNLVVYSVFGMFPLNRTVLDVNVVKRF